MLDVIWGQWVLEVRVESIFTVIHIDYTNYIRSVLTRRAHGVAVAMSTSKAGLAVLNGNHFHGCDLQYPVYNNTLFSVCSFLDILLFATIALYFILFNLHDFLITVAETVCTVFCSVVRTSTLCWWHFSYQSMQLLWKVSRGFGVVFFWRGNKEGEHRANK